jgi:hypothetical protein
MWLFGLELTRPMFLGFEALAEQPGGERVAVCCEGLARFPELQQWQPGG